MLQLVGENDRSGEHSARSGADGALSEARRHDASFDASRVLREAADDEQGGQSGQSMSMRSSRSPYARAVGKTLASSEAALQVRVRLALSLIAAALLMIISHHFCFAACAGDVTEADADVVRRRALSETIATHPATLAGAARVQRGAGRRSCLRRRTISCSGEAKSGD